MRFTTASYSLLAMSLALQSTAQQIFDVWTTTEDKSQLLQYTKQSPPINFTVSSSFSSRAKSSTGVAAHITVDDSQVLQTIHGFGATLTDSAATTLASLKASNETSYNELLNKLFDPTDANFENAGLSYLRVPLGATDFSATTYTYDDTPNDKSLSNFSIDAAPKEVFDVMTDIIAINKAIKVHFVPWSPPGWMKDSKTMKGGSLKQQFISTYATYLLKALQGWQSKGVRAFALSIQNEPENDDGTYPTCAMPPAVEAQIGAALRPLMDAGGFNGTRLVGYEHNWVHAGAYPVTLLQAQPAAFAGVSFHCYAGTVAQQAQFTQPFPGKEVFFTECAGTLGSDFWADLKFNTDNIILGAQERRAGTGLFWVLAGDEKGGPKLPGTDSCGGAGCRPVVTVSGGGYALNTEFFAAAQASKATIPKDEGGPEGKRIASKVDTGLLRVGAYVTGRNDPQDKERYSLVVMNWNDAGKGTPMKTSIKFRGTQATYTFPVGVTTLTWYAPSTSNGTVPLSPSASANSTTLLPSVSLNSTVPQTAKGRPSAATTRAASRRMSRHNTHRYRHSI